MLSRCARPPSPAFRTTCLESFHSPCRWSGFVSIPYVPNANIELIEGLLPQTCSDKLLTPELKRNCRSCERRATRGECLRGIAQTWNNGAGGQAGQAVALLCTSGAGTHRRWCRCRCCSTGAGKHPSMSISCVLCPAADRQSCNWLSWNARGEKVREVNYTLGKRCGLPGAAPDAGHPPWLSEACNSPPAGPSA